MLWLFETSILCLNEQSSLKMFYRDSASKDVQMCSIFHDRDRQVYIVDIYSKQTCVSPVC